MIGADVVDGEDPNLTLVRPETVTTYNQVGKPLTVTDARGNTTTTEYDHAYRAIKVIMPPVEVYGQTGLHASTTETEYDPSGNPLKVIDPNGNATINTYDPLG